MIKASFPCSLGQIVSEVEEAIIRDALIETFWNVAQAAQLVGLNRTTLVARLEKLNLMDEVRANRELLKQPKEEF